MVEDTLNSGSFNSVALSTYDDSLVSVETGCHVSKILNLSLEQRDEQKDFQFQRHDKYLN